MKDKILNLPKCELHLHIEGTLEPELMLELAEKNNILLPFASIEEIKKAYNFKKLQDFLDLFHMGSIVLIDESDFERLTWEYLLKCKRDNVVHVEIFFDPQTHIARGVSFETVVNGITKALDKGFEELEITSRLIMCFLRHLSEKKAFETLEMALPFKNKIIGVGLDSDEMNNPPSKFKRVFQKAIEEGFFTVAHAGEEAGAEYIKEALELLHVSRIDHGVRCVEDVELVKTLAREEMPLTVCPLSNVKLKVFQTMKEHNILELLERGLCVSVNSDDPAYFGGYLYENFVELYDELHMDESQLKKLIINSFNSAVLSNEQRTFWIQQVING